MRGVFNTRTPVQKKSMTWDPEIVLNSLQQVDYLTCSINMLSCRLAVLILLTTGQRPQILKALRLSSMLMTPDIITFSVTVKDVKQGRPGYAPPPIMLTKFEDERLCVVSHLRRYLKLTEVSSGDTDELFITCTKPVRAVTLNTLSRWVKTVLLSAGIDTKLASAGSTRAASTSKALEGGRPWK